MRAQTGQQTEDGQPIGVIRTRTAVCAPSQRVDDEIPSPRLLPYRPPVTAAEGGAPSGGDYTYTALPGDTYTPDARAWASMVAVGHGDSRHVVLIGGRKPRGQIHGPPVPCETLFVFDTARDCWQKLPTRGRAPSARFAAATSALGSSRLFLSGGIAAEGVRRDAFVLTLRRGGRSQAPGTRGAEPPPSPMRGVMASEPVGESEISAWWEQPRLTTRVSADAADGAVAPAPPASSRPTSARPDAARRNSSSMRPDAARRNSKSSRPAPTSMGVLPSARCYHACAAVGMRVYAHLGCHSPRDKRSFACFPD